LYFAKAAGPGASARTAPANTEKSPQFLAEGGQVEARDRPDRAGDGEKIFGEFFEALEWG
jgi:hypothetical protein